MRWAIIFFILSMFVIVACKPVTTTSTLEQQELLDKEQIKEIDSINEERSPQQEAALQEPSKPTGGKINIEAHTEKQLPVIDEFADVKMSTKGGFDYTINGDGVVSGDGRAKVIIDVSAPFSESSDCSAHKEVDVTFSVSGAYNFETNTLLYFSHDPTPDDITITLTCNYAGSDLTYQLPVPVVFFGGDQIELVYTREPKITKTLVHPVPVWEDDIEIDWNFELVPLEDFDFDVDVDPTIVSVKQGQVARAQVVVKKIRGEGQVSLTHTNWPNLLAELSLTTVTPTATSEFIVQTECTTPADTYLYTIQGDAGIIKQSTDSVSIVVEADPTCT